MRPLRWSRMWLGLWLLAVAAVIVLSLVPAPQVAMAAPRHFDKLLHFCAYFSLMFGAVQVFSRMRILLSVALALIALGGLMEFAQAALVPHLRMFDPWDALANAAGVMAGVFIAATPMSGSLQRLERVVSRA